MTTGTAGKMKAIKTNKACAVCLQESKHLSEEDGGICPSCTNIVDLLRNKPDALQQLSRIAGVTETSCLQAMVIEKELPDVLNGVRYRTTDRERNTWYVSVSELDANPVEIFASTAFDRDQHLQSRISNLTTITRLISLILRHIFLGERLTLEKTLTQLKRSSRQPNDLPDMLGKILAKYTDKTQKKEKETIDNDTAAL